MLNVHHLHYKRGAAPWEYDDNELVTLCESCHKKEHDEIKSSIYDIKIGDFVRYSHSDWDNFGIVYFLDFDTMTGMIASIDDGSDYTRLWIETVRIKPDGTIDSYNGRNLTRDKEGYIEADDVSFEESSYSGFFYRCLAQCLAEIGEYYEKRDINHFEIMEYDIDAWKELCRLHDNLPIMQKNNDELNQYFKEHGNRTDSRR